MNPWLGGCRLELSIAQLLLKMVELVLSTQGSPEVLPGTEMV